MTIGYVMVNLHCGNKARGSVMGINCLFGAIALLILAKLGGLAFDKIDKSIPFLFASLGSAILLLIVLFTRSKVDALPQHRHKDMSNSGNEIKGALNNAHLNTHVDLDQKI
jgi:fucose permease